MGGAALTEDYELEESGYGTLSYETQRRDPKSLRYTEQALQERIRSTTDLKFGGKLTIEDGAKEYDLEKFCEVAKEGVREHGLEPLFYCIDSEGKMRNIVIDKHRFSYEEILKEHAERLNTLKIEEFVKQKRGGQSEHILHVAKGYDTYERRDLALSRLFVRGLITDDMYERVKARFQALGDEFDRQPGQVLFIQIMDTCNANLQIDLDKATSDFEALDLKDFAGQDVTKMAEKAQQSIRTLNQSYALDIHLGSKFLNKLIETESHYFNSLVIDQLKKVKAMERQYVAADPRTILKDTDYSKLGPLACTDFVQQQHGELLAEHQWPALRARLPEANQVSLQANGTQVNPRHAHLRCRKCHKMGHIARNCKAQGKTTEKDSEKTIDGETDEEKRKKRQAASAWKYITPADKSKPTEVGGRKYWFCDKCNNGKGMFTLSHCTDGTYSGKKHDPNFKPTRQKSGPEAHVAAITPQTETLDGSGTKMSEQASVKDDTKSAPVQVSLRFRHGDPGAAWMAVIMDDPPAPGTSPGIIGLHIDQGPRLERETNSTNDETTSMLPTPDAETWHIAMSELSCIATAAPMAGAAAVPKVSVAAPVPLKDMNDLEFEALLTHEAHEDMLYYFDARETLVDRLVDHEYYMEPHEHPVALEDMADEVGFYDTVDDRQGEWIKDCVFFDSRTDEIPESHDSPPTPLRRTARCVTVWLRAQVQPIMVWWLVTTSLLQALLNGILTIEDDIVPRRQRRWHSKRPHCWSIERPHASPRPSLYTFPKSWLVFVGAIMLLPGGIQPDTPRPVDFDMEEPIRVYHDMRETLERIAYTIDVGPTTVWHVHMSQCRNLWDWFTKVEMEDEQIEKTILLTPSDDDYFVDTVESIDPYDEYLDALSGDDSEWPTDINSVVWTSVVDVPAFILEGDHDNDENE
jgi:hypothetical protein